MRPEPGGWCKRVVRIEVDDVEVSSRRGPGVEPLPLTGEAELLLTGDSPDSFTPPGWSAGVTVSSVQGRADPVPGVLQSKPSLVTRVGEWQEAALSLASLSGGEE